ncbi:hypothetical protein DYBT9275_01985 [Dyadobacter sp. CECT 9275]|uniref:VanZ-like domain-containing protein n=1 Tax=Dyadobacter helix TaxID=2822344 RepID=A0A916NBJ1_9BACT|nr:VanZ family protein [Dyadobacter sp. CECT 9275]CAG4998361.1 hypothetical protein DYBT9275_01985 [Dyadobacter sp. CECT 9275]
MLPTILRFFTQSPIASWFWTFLILLACTWPGKDIPAAPVVGFDKLVHAGLFIVWINLWLLQSKGNANRLIVIGMGYGLALEFYQQLLPFDRTFDWWDAVADAVGVLTGYLFFKFIMSPYLQRLY